MNTETDLKSFIWGIANILRGPFKASEYGNVILPFTLLRRLECVLEPTKEKVLDTAKTIDVGMAESVLPSVSGERFYNISQFDLDKVGSTSTLSNLEHYISGFSPNSRQVFDYFNFTHWLEKLDENNILYEVCRQFAAIDLHPDRVPNHQMGDVFEHLIHKFAETKNDSAGEFYTPRDVVQLVTRMVFNHDAAALGGEGVIRTVYDPTCGTGGFLSSAMETIDRLSDGSATVRPYGQELNPETYAICVADMLIKGDDPNNIKRGNTLSDDQLRGERFNYGLANPPFGVDWKVYKDPIEAEHENLGFAGRFGPGLPRKDEGSLLFLLHLISKMKQPTKDSEAARIGIVLNGSSLFNGGAGSGESEIRRWILEKDLLEAIVALPTDMFYNTGIQTYVWILSNNKDEPRRGKVQLIDASDIWTPMRKSLGSKRRFLTDEQQKTIESEMEAFEDSEISKIFDYREFGYRRITVDRPLRLNFEATPERVERLKVDKKFAKLDLERQTEVLLLCESLRAKRYTNRDDFVDQLNSNAEDAGLKLKKSERDLILDALSERDPEADVCLDKNGKPEHDKTLRDYENVPLLQSVEDFFWNEVKPHVDDAWIADVRDEKDEKLGKVGYEINFNRYFYTFEPPRPLEAIDTDLQAIEDEIHDMLKGVTR